MEPIAAKQIFVNLPVKDLKKSVQNAACMIIGENIFAMLLLEKFFGGFTPKEICDAQKATEVLNALSFGSREKVDEITMKAIQAGGREPREPQEHGYMYARSIEDLDGHIWEVFFMDEKAMPQKPDV
ncbi:glyoxalase/bleomycin resistance/extradiol dioxygenase family protein [Candidatus Woesearchaeota archaeon]|nr:glyoxalase/bleomycin resistance/extradiol dioxygenase family protein [Candidatus Woesearchaeota archaeon]